MSTDKRKVLKPLKEMETIWHPESTLVFKSKTEKVVTGRWINSEFLPFDEEAVELCSQWSFKYDQELYNELMAEEEEEGSDEVEGETEEGDVPAGDEVVGEGDDVVGEGDVQAGDEVEDVSGEVETVVSNDDLNNLTSNFTNNLNSYFQKLSNDYCAKISDLETKLAKMTEDRDKIKDMYSSVKEECDKLKAKFEGFKSFFMA